MTESVMSNQWFRN